MANTNNNQSWLDATIQATGTLENLFLLAVANGISVTDNPATGTPYAVPADAVADTLALQQLTGYTIGTRGW